MRHDARNRPLSAPRRWPCMAAAGAPIRRPGAVAVPIYQTTSYQFQDTDARRPPVCAGRDRPHLHARLQSDPGRLRDAPRCARGRRGRAGARLGPGGLGLFASSISPAPATTSSASTDLYGGTWALFAATLKHFGIEVRFVDPADPENFRRATDDAHPRLLRGIAAQPEAAGLPDQGGRRHRPLAWRAADRRQHRRAADHPAVRSRRRRRRLFHHQIYRRPRHVDRRRRSSTAATFPGRSMPSASRR